MADNYYFVDGVRMINDWVAGVEEQKVPEVPDWGPAVEEDVAQGFEEVAEVAS